MIACLFIRSKSPRPFPSTERSWAKTFFYTSSRAAFIHHEFLSRTWYLFLVLFNRCRVPPFPARESPSALSGRAIALPYVRLVVQKTFFLPPKLRISGYIPCIFKFLKAQTHSYGVLFQVQSLFNKDLFPFLIFFLKEGVDSLKLEELKVVYLLKLFELLSLSEAFGKIKRSERSFWISAIY